jgi:hypothetical protein
MGVRRALGAGARGPATKRWLADNQGVIRRQQMSRADVAAFLVSLTGGQKYSRATVALSG